MTTGTDIEADGPLVSVVLTTRDRPQFLPIALACYRHQAYARRELIVVDDGSVYPVDDALIEEYGGRLIRVTTGTPLGIKLNRGVEVARGRLCMKMDDDDWYGPAYLQTMVERLMATRQVVCQPTIAFLTGFLFFDLASWQLRESVDYNLPGATLLFAREDWQARPFRPLATDEDLWFIRDQVSYGGVTLSVPSIENYVAIRHSGHGANRGHTWTHQASGERLEDYLKERPIYTRAPEELLPDWAVAAYRRIRDELAGPGVAAETSGPA